MAPLVNCGLTMIPDAILAPFSGSSKRMDANGERYGNVMQIGAPGTISRVYFSTGSVTAGDEIRISIQGVSDGLPDGTILATATGNNAYGDYTLTTGGNFYVDLVEPVDVVRGQWVATVIEFVSRVSGDFYLSTWFRGQNIYGSMVYAVQDISVGSWSKQSPTPHTLLPCFDDGTFPLNGMVGASMGSSMTIAVNSATQDEVGNLFRLPFPCRAIGAYFFGDMDGDAQLVLLSAAASLTGGSLTIGTTYRIHTYALDDDFTNVGAASNAVNVIFTATGDTPAHWAHSSSLEIVLGYSVLPNTYRSETGIFLQCTFFSTTQELAPNTWYRIVCTPITTTSLIIRSGLVPTAAMMDNLPLGANCVLTRRIDGGAWTDGTLSRASIGIMVDQISDGSTGGGGGRPELRGGNL